MCRMHHANEDTTGRSGQAFSLNTLSIGLLHQMYFFLTSWYYLTLLGRLNSTKDGGAHLRWLHRQLGWDGTLQPEGSELLWW